MKGKKGAVCCLHAGLIALVIVVFVDLARAESAFSALGFGLMAEQSTIRAGGMGMVSLVLPDTHAISRTTPALWHGPATARFGFAGSITQTSTTDIWGTDASAQSSLTNVAMALPVGGGVFAGVGLSPYTRVAYKWTTSTEAGWNESLVRRQGRGGLSQGIVGLSIPVASGMRVGFGGRAVFGKIERLLRFEFPGADARTAVKTTSDRFRGVGAAGSAHITWRGFWFAGMSVFSPVSAMLDRQTLITAGGSVQSDTTITGGEPFDLPWDISLGFGRRFDRHAAAVEYAWHGWGSAEHPVDLTVGFQDAARLSFGWEWSPVHNPLDPFWRSVTYRAGVYTVEHYAPDAAGNAPRLAAVTGGLSIPYFERKSRLDIAVEWGWMGSSAGNGASERSIGISIGINHSEQWFINRRDRR